MVKTVGKVSIQPSGQWVKANTYNKLQLVSNLGSSYLAIQPVPANTEIDNTSYWMMIASKGDKGNTGKSIQTITKTGTVGLVDTYTILYSDLTTSTFTVNNGNGVTDIEVEKTGTSGNVDTYTMTITMASGEPYVSTFTITNGEDGDVQASAIAEPYDNTVAYKIGNLLSASGKMYLTIKDAPAGTPVTNTEYFEEKSVADIVEMIKTGEITVGKANLANNFDSKMVLTDNSGYLYRTTGGSLEVGEQNRVKKIIGASVPIINPLKNGNFAEKVAWLCTDGSTAWSVANNKATVTWTPSYTRNGLYQENTFTVGHKYYVQCTVKNTSENNVTFYLGQPYGVNIHTMINSGKTKTISGFLNISNASTAGGYELTVGIYGTSSSQFTMEVSKAICIDLTATFGTTVANRLYALEQAQAGTGIAKAKEILVKDYYPYNVTAFTHTKTSGKVNNGFNQWDEQWESGDINSETGQPSSASDRIRSKNYIEVFPNTAYCFTCPSPFFRVYAYDSNYGFIDRIVNASTAVNIVTTPNNAKYLKFATKGTYGTTYKNDICINLHWDGERDGEYEPYQKWNYPVQDIELKGILSLDAQDNWVADGDEYIPSGVVTERVYAATFNGTGVTWQRVINSHDIAYFRTPLPKKVINASVESNLRCNRLIPIAYNYSAATSYNGSIGFMSDKTTLCIVPPTDIADVDAFNTWLASNIVSIEYLVAAESETESSTTPYTELQNDSNWGTEKWIDTRDVPMPVFSTCEYIPDLKAKVETAPESPDEDGDYIMHRENGLNSYGSLSTWLSANGYNKLQDVSSAIEELTGFTFMSKKALVTGKLVTINIVAKNTSGADITNPMFTATSALPRPNYALNTPCYIGNTITRLYNGYSGGGAYFTVAGTVGVDGLVYIAVTYVAY